MAIIPAQATLIQIDNMAVPLVRYFHIINQDECAGFGVDNPSDSQVTCDKIWTKGSRDMAERSLKEAQDEIQQITNYFLTPTWVTNEHQRYTFPLQSDWGRVIIGGIEATDDISLGAAVSHATDPAVIGPIVTTVTIEDEIRIFHPGTDFEITPSAVSISGGSVTINVPRCRMVLASLADNPDEGLAYSVTANFEATVDVKRVYNDPSTNADLVWPHACTTSCNEGGCSEFIQDGCIYLRDRELGFLDILPAVFSGGTWSRAVTQCCNGSPSYARLNYRAGLDPITPQAEDAIVRLAHSKMPDELCGCDTWSRFWERDRNIPEVLTRERLNCPFGLNDGAWIAYRFAQSLEMVRGHAL